MTTTQARPVFSYVATVKARAEAADGFILDLDIPAFNSRYPTKVTRVPAAMALLLMPGTTHTLLLERQNLKSGKTGTVPYDYYWGLREIAIPNAPAAPDEGPPFSGEPPPVIGPTPASRLGSDAPKAPPRGNGQGEDPTRVSIEAQVCLKEAWETVRDLIRSDKLDPDNMADVKAALFRYTMMGMAALHEAKQI